MTELFERVRVIVTKGHGLARKVYAINEKERFVTNFSLEPDEAFTLPEGWEEIPNLSDTYAAEYAPSLCNIDGYISLPVTLIR